jgi:hypothetical protein
VALVVVQERAETMLAKPGAAVPRVLCIHLLLALKDIAV